MAGTKISALTAAAALGGTEEIPGVQSAANVKITAAQIKAFTSASPTLVTPVLGVAAATSIAVGGATIGSNALAVTGTANISGNTTVGRLLSNIAQISFINNGADNRTFFSFSGSADTATFGVSMTNPILQFGVATSAGPGLRRNGTTLEVKLADNSADAPLTASNLIASGFFKSGSHTVATVPSAASSGAGAHIYVSDEVGGATPAFSDATDWRRYADRAIIS